MSCMVAVTILCFIDILDKFVDYRIIAIACHLFQQYLPLHLRYGSVSGVLS